jgi:hypothetical protein
MAVFGQHIAVLHQQPLEIERAAARSFTEDVAVAQAYSEQLAIINGRVRAIQQGAGQAALGPASQALNGTLTVPEAVTVTGINILRSIFGPTVDSLDDGRGGVSNTGPGSSRPLTPEEITELFGQTPTTTNVVNNYFGAPTTEQVAAAEREYVFRNGPRIFIS